MLIVVGLFLLPGCPQPPPCANNPCDDGDNCTVDTCTADDTVSARFTCAFDDVVCADNGVCDPADGECVTCLSDDDCDNGKFCDGVETCADNQCITGPVPCDVFAEEVCKEDTDTCDVICTNDADCAGEDNGFFCTGSPVCDTATGACGFGGNPCAAGEVCDEFNDACVECLVDTDCASGETCNLNSSECNEPIVAATEAFGLMLEAAENDENAVRPASKQFVRSAAAVYDEDFEHAHERVAVAVASHIASGDDLRQMYNVEQILSGESYVLYGDEYMSATNAKALRKSDASRQFAVIFINGVLNSLDAARHSAEELNRLLRSDPNVEPQIAVVSWFYNVSGKRELDEVFDGELCPIFGGIGDDGGQIAEAVIDRIGLDNLSAICATGGFRMINGFVPERLEDATIDFSEASAEKVLELLGTPSAGSDAKKLADIADEFLKDGLHVVFVGHSQGNFKIEGALQRLSGTFGTDIAKRVGVIAVGSPASYAVAANDGITIRKFNVRTQPEVPLPIGITFGALGLLQQEGPSDIVATFDSEQPRLEWLPSKGRPFPEVHYFGNYLKDYGHEIVSGIKDTMEDLAPAQADLLGSYCRVLHDPADAGDSIDPFIEFGIRNDGGTDSGNYHVEWYLSTDEIIDMHDYRLTGIDYASLPAHGSTGRLTQALELPPAGNGFWVGDGDYYIGMIVDVHGMVAESDEGNNNNRGSGLDLDVLRVNHTSTPSLPAPTGVSASQGTFTNKIHLSWNTVSAAEGYDLYRHTSNNPNSATLIRSYPTGSADEHDDLIGDGLVRGTTYYYWVRSTQSSPFVQSGFSNAATGWLDDEPPPNPASCSVTPSALSFGSVAVGDTAMLTITFENTGTVDFQYDTGFAGFNENWDWFGADQGTLQPGDMTDVRVRFQPQSTGTKSMTVSFGNALCAEVVCTGTGDSGSLSAPSGLTASQGAFGFKIELVWNAVPSADTYNIYRSTTNNQGSAAFWAWTAATSAEDNSDTLDPGTTYYYWVQAQRDNPLELSGLSASAAGWLDDSSGGPDCDVSPTSINFGTVNVGETKTRTFTITNTGGQDLLWNLNGCCDGSTDDWSFGSGYIDDSVPIRPGESRTIPLRFHPVQSGFQAYTVGLGSQLCEEVSATGTGG